MEAALKNSFLEIGVPKAWKWKNFGKVNVEKFTFSSVEASKPATSVLANSFLRHLPMIFRSSRPEVYS